MKAAQYFVIGSCIYFKEKVEKKEESESDNNLLPFSLPLSSDKKRKSSKKSRKQKDTEES